MERIARQLRYFILALDIVWALAALMLSHNMPASREPLRGAIAETRMYLPILFVSVIGWWAISDRCELDGFRRGWRLSRLLAEVIVSVGILSGILATCAFLLRDFVPKLVVVRYVALLALGFLVIRISFHLALTSSSYAPNRRVVIIGFGQVAQELAHKFESHPELRCKVVGFLYPSNMRTDPAPSECRGQEIETRDVGTMQLLTNNKVTDLIVVSETEQMAYPIAELAAHCRKSGMLVSVVPRTYQLYLSRAVLMNIEGVPILQLDKVSVSRIATTLKRFLDITVAILALPVAVPLVAMSGAYLYIASGSAFRRELRCGQHGRPFFMWRLNSERESSHRRVGRLLHTFSITELPQLWNVLKGEMSLVGPRPEIPERVQSYSEWQRQRLRVPPGVTGLAQVHGLRDQSSSEEKSYYDLQYIASSTLATDCALLIETVWVLLTRSSTRAEEPSIAAAVGLRTGTEQC